MNFARSSAVSWPDSRSTVTPYFAAVSRIQRMRSTYFAYAAGSPSSRKPPWSDMYRQPSSCVSAAPFATIAWFSAQCASGTMPPVFRIVSSVE